MRVVNALARHHARRRVEADAEWDRVRGADDARRAESRRLYKRRMARCYALRARMHDLILQSAIRNLQSAITEGGAR